MSFPDAGIVVLGIGNTLLRDDGVGVHVVRELERLADQGQVALPPGTTLLDAGTLGQGLLPWLAGAGALVIVDAAEMGAQAGAVSVTRGEEIGMVPAPTAAGWGGVLALLRDARLAGALPPATSLIGIQPGVIEIGLELSGPARAALPAAIAATLRELEDLAAGMLPGASPRAGRGLVGATA